MNPITPDPDIDPYLEEYFQHDKPIEAPEHGMDAIKHRAKEHSCFTFTWGGKHKTFVDATTACMLVTCYDSLKPENQQKLDRMIRTSRTQFMQVIDICWKAVRT